ncbi:hypothetical protein AMJ44_10850 [candidate division WOR-1 bacterium DG_54_3]|uniref:Uncharacterized protein n=1 Tax=candidate division WOR-1 bacterium DG_54_3 TaxID=1703775 RepID=A0A0S7XRU3_UNCSA|nr:MAG: hypothetical protein AMJ44_10850 [candidate division WOR-1 bacterium DG_54_3]
MTKRRLIALIVFALILGIAYPSLAAQKKYPQLAISGYKRWLYSKFDVDPTVNYYLALGDRLPANGPWAEELQLYISGQLSENLSVNYDLNQNAFTAGRFNVDVNFHNYSLLFGHLSELNEHEFVLQDYMSCVGIGGRWDKFKAIYFYGTYPGAYHNYSSVSLTEDYDSYRLYRNPQYNGDIVYTYYKDNPYLEFLSLDLGRVDIVEDSVVVHLDNSRLIRNADFYVDRAYGLVLISSAYKNAEMVKVSYVLNNGEKKEVVFDFKEDARRRAFLSDGFRVIDGSEIVTVDGMRLVRDLDYRINYNTGLVVMNEPLHEDSEVRISYDYTYGANLYAKEVISGQVGTTFTLAHRYILSASETVIKNNQILSPDTDYTMGYTNGWISFVTPLTSSDTVEVGYTYIGIRQEVMGANAEYELSKWSKIGSSVVSITPSKKDEPIFDETSPSSYLIWNLYNTSMLNEDTFIRSEVSLSNRNVDYRNSNTTEADSALEVYARTRLGSVLLSGTYRKTGLNFASIRKVKSGTDYKNEEGNIDIKFMVGQYFTLKSGFESALEQVGSASSPEVSMQVYSIGLEPQLSDVLKMDFNIKQRKQNIVGQQLEAVQDSQQAYSSLDLDKAFPAVRNFCEDTKLIFKYLNIKDKGEIQGGGVYINKDSRSTRSEVGCLIDFKGSLSSYILYKNEEERDLLTASTATRIIPFYRVSYQWDLGGGHNLELCYDYSTTQQGGVTEYNKVDYGFSLVYDFQIENPIISKFQFGGSTKMTDYTDSNNPANDYKATETSVYGSLIF